MAFYCNGKKDMCECDILCADCQHYDNTGGKKWQTNADRIRAMSDEELSTLLCDISDCSHCRWGEYSGCTVREWLKQPAEGE